MKDLLIVFKVTIGLFFLSTLYVAIKKKEVSMDLFLSGVDFFPYAFLLVACYYFYNKNK